DSAVLAKLLTFASVAMGAAGCILGGLVADRIGRTTLTVAAMAISGTCCLLAGPLFGGDPSILGVLCLVWGCTVVADSPQFTASVIELSDRTLTGTMITVQTCAGFLLTTITIHLTPFLVDWIGWRHAFAVLAIGPALGIWAMLRLRFHPDAVRLANGRR
ncbi:MAG TPA: MFS transporter, partial [Stellaceae bacterium]|nr:MFS transporter [Stellaceae bacterium]